VIKAVLEALHREPLTLVAIVADWNRSQIVTRSKRHRIPSSRRVPLHKKAWRSGVRGFQGRSPDLFSPGTYRPKWIKWITSLDMARIMSRIGRD
jgi:hypothetical protein